MALAELGRAMIHGLAWAVLVSTMAPPSSVLVAFAGGFGGSLVGSQLGQSRIRTSAIFAGAVFLIALVAWFRASLTHGSFLAASFGPVGALRLASMLTALLVAAIGSAATRAGSTRRAIFSVFELLLVAVAFGQLFVAHRHGAINRPFYLADWIIALGWDPTWLFLFMGGTATVLGLVLLLREQRFGRAVLNLGMIGLLLALIVVATPLVGMPPPPDGGGGLGLRPEESEAKEGKGQQQERGGASASELEFRDKYNPGGARVPVAVVLFHDDYSPPSGVYYFRQGAFSQYNGRKLVVSGRKDIDNDLIPYFPARLSEIANAPEVNENRGPLETTIALMADHTQPFALESPIEVEPMQNPSPNRFRRVYRAMSAVLTADYTSMLDASPGSSDWSKEQWAHYTETPPDPRYSRACGRAQRRASGEAGKESGCECLCGDRLARTRRHLQPQKPAQWSRGSHRELFVRRSNGLLRALRPRGDVPDAKPRGARPGGHRLCGERISAPGRLLVAPVRLCVPCLAGGVPRWLRLGGLGCVSRAGARSA